MWLAARRVLEGDIGGMMGYLISHRVPFEDLGLTYKSTENSVFCVENTWTGAEAEHSPVERPSC